jgi:hypothetical protein
MFQDIMIITIFTLEIDISIDQFPQNTETKTPDLRQHVANITWSLVVFDTSRALT